MLLLTAALVGPYFVDWTTYRADFEREASRILGREVKVEGAATARILPFPSVTFTDVRVAGTGSKPALTAEKFSMDAELAPFLRGELLIFDMRIERPKGVLKVGNDGAVDWAMRPNTPFDPGNVSIEKLTVTEGAVSIEHAASGRIHTLTEINTDVTATTVAGPWRITGSLRLDGALTDIDLSTGRLDESGAMRLRLRAKPQRYPFSIETDGTARLDLGAPKYEASFKLSGYDEDVSLRGTNGDTFTVIESEGSPRRPPDYRMSGRLTFDHRRLAATEFVLETGPVEDPYTAEGTADLDLGGEPRFSVEATGAQFRFDDRVQEDVRGSLTLERRIAAMKAFVSALPRPTIPGSVEVNLPAVVAGDTTFRDVRLSAEPTEGGWAVKDFAASMPGRTTLEADGFVATSEEDASFVGNMLLAVGQPSGFAAWLSKDVDDAIRRLPRAGFSARVDLTSARQTLDDATLQLGNARFRGRLDSVTPDNANPSLLVSLEGEALDVEGLAAFASLFVTEGGRTRMGGRDLDLKVAAGPVSVGGLTAARLETAMRLKDGRLDVDRLTINDLAGANLSATGTLNGFPSAPSGSLDAAIVSEDLGPLAGLLGDRYPDSMLARGLADRLGGLSALGRDARINIVATATDSDRESRFAISAGGEMGGSDFTVAWSSAGPFFTPNSLDINLTAENPDGAAILELYGLPVLPLEGIGPASTELSLKGSPISGMTAMGKLSSDNATASFDGTVSVGPNGTASGRGRIEGVDLEPWLSATGLSLPGMGFGLPLDLGADLRLSGGRLDVTGLEGTVGDVSVTGNLGAVIADGVPLLSGAVTTAFLPLDLALELVLGQGALSGDGEAWSTSAFAPRATAPFAAALEVEAGSIGWGVETVAKNAGFRMRIGDDGLSVSELSADVGGGRLTGLFEIRNNDGTAALTSQLAATGIEADKLPGASALSAKANLSASISASGKSVEAMVASLSGTGSGSLTNPTVEGINPRALAAFIAEADLIGRDIKDAAVNDFAPLIASQGTFSGGNADLSFTLAGGVLRTSPVTLSDGKTQLSAELRADLAEWNIETSGEIAYDAGPEALVGSQPTVNFAVSGAPGQGEVTFDVQPMAQFLTQRALEIEQARVEAMQAVLLEKQRLRREVRYYAALTEERAKAEAERRRLEEEARLQAEAEAKAKAEEEARLKAEAEAKRKAQAEAEAKAAEEARRQTEAEEEAKRKAEAKAKAEREARRKAEEEARLKAEQAAKRKAEADAAAKAKALEEAEAKAQASARREAARKTAEEAARTPVEPVDAAPRENGGGDSALQAAQDAQAAAEAEARAAEKRQQGASRPSGGFVDMAGRPRQNGEVRRPAAPVQPEPKPEEREGFSLDRLFRAFGGN